MNIEKLRGDYLKIIDKAMARLPEKYETRSTEIYAEAYRYWGIYALYYGATTDGRTDIVRSLRTHVTFRASVFWVVSMVPEYLLNYLRKMYRV